MASDGRGRAYGAAADALWGQMHRLSSEEAAVKAVDAALASGGVVECEREADVAYTPSRAWEYDGPVLKPDAPNK